MFRFAALSIAAIAPFAIAPFAIALPALAQSTPADLRDMVGARAGQAEGELGRRGYGFVRTESGGDRKWSYWWNADTRTCVTIVTTDGRYAAITAGPAPDCRQSADNGDRPYPPQPGYGGPGYGGPGNGGPGYGGPGGGSGDLTLICYGGGAAYTAQNGWDYQWDDRDGRFVPRYGTRLGRDGFSSDVEIQLTGGNGWIHLRGKMVPPINSGGLRGWWPLSDVQVTRNQITARYRLNGLNKPRVTIDRRSGRISIQGMTGFNGRCDIGNWGSGRRF